MDNEERGAARFSVGETFSDALAIMGARWRAMLGATVLMMIVIFATYGLFAWPLFKAMLTNPVGYANTMPVAAFGWAFLGGLVAMIFSIWLLVAVLKIALDVDTPHGVIASLTGALPKLLPVIGIAFCVFVTMIALYIACAIVIAILAFVGVMIGDAASAVMLVIGFTLFFVAIIYVMLGWVAAVPAMLVEDLGPIQSMARSWRLVRGNRLRLTALWVFSYIVMTVIILLVVLLTLPGFFAAMGGDVAALQSSTLSTPGLIAYMIFNVLFGIVVQLFFASLFASTYRNLAGIDSDPARSAATFA